MWAEDAQTVSNNSGFNTPALTETALYYTVRGTMDGCYKDSTVNTVVRKLPEIKITGAPQMTICRDNDIELHADKPTRGWDYKWGNSQYQTNDTVYSAYITTDGEQFTLWGKDEHGCENSDVITIKLEDRPTFDVTGDVAVCMNTKAEVYATNGELEYVWKNVKDETIGKTNGTDKLAITISQDTTLTVYGKVPGRSDCDVTRTYSITANPYPTITVVKDTDVVCKGTIAYIEVKTDIDATFEWNTNETDRYIQKAIDQKSQFSVTATSIENTSCSTVKTFDVDIWNLPTVVADPVAICYGEKAQLTATSTDAATPATFRWLSASTDGETFETPELTSNTTYKVQVTDAHKCVNTTTTEVSINPLPTFTIERTTPVCRGWEATLTAQSSDARTLSYIWEDDKDGTYDVKNTFVHSVGQDTTFVVWAKDELGCKQKKESTVKVKEFPTLSLRMESDTVCYGESRTLYVSGANNGYNWTIEGNTVSTVNYYKLENVTSRTEISVTGITSDCPSTIDTVIKVWDLPTITIQQAAPICLGQNVNLIADGGVPDSYKWNTGETDDNITPTPNKIGENTYSVSAKDIHGCKNNAETKVVVNALPNVSITAPEEVCRNTTGVLEAVAPTAQQYEWHNADGTIIAGETLKEYTATIDEDSKQYWVVVTDNNQCVDSADITIRAKEFPTPNHRTSTGRDSVCVGSAITIYVSGAESYEWEDGTTSNSISETLTEPKSFTVTATTNGCSTPLTIDIDTLQLPIFKVDGGEICLNDSIKLSAGKNTALNRTGELTYKWKHNGSTQSTIVEIPISTRTYSVVGTDEYSCKATATAEVIVNPLPTDLKIDGDNAICKNDNVNLKANSASAVEYVWYNDKDTTKASALLKRYNATESESLNAEIVKDTTFYAVAIDQKGCRYMVSHDITKVDHPTLVLSYPDSVCYGDRASISIKNASTYVWDVDGSTKSYRTDVITSDTIFTVTGYANGCSTSDFVKIHKLDLPVISIDVKTDKGTNEICRGQNKATLTGKGGLAGGYTWSTKETTDAITVAPTNNQLYKVTGTGKNGCKNTVDTTIKVNGLPVISIEGISEICENDSFTLKAVSSDDFKIEKYDWTGYSQFTADSIVAAIRTNQTFHVNVTDTNGCTNDAEKSVTAKKYPEVKATAAPQNVCRGDNTMISVQGASTYLWKNGEGTTARSFIVTPTSDTTFYVEGTLNGCTTSDSIRVKVNELPNITIESLGNRTEICQNDTLRLTAKDNNLPNKTTFKWSNNDAASYTEVYPMTTTKYIVTGTDAITSCHDTAEFTLKVNTLPVFSIEGKDLVCKGDEDTLFVKNAEAATYKWLSNSNMLADTLIKKIDTTTVFRVEATDANACKSIQTKTVRTKAYPVVSISAPDEVCDGNVATLTATGAATYVWEKDNSTSNSINDTVRQTTTYVVRGTTNGCTTEQKHTITKLTLPTVQISRTKDSICFGGSTYLSGPSGLSYIWSNGSSLQGITVKPTTTTDYILIGRDAKQCEARDTITITVNPLPNVNITGTDAVCDGSNAELIANGATSYTWTTTGETTDTIRPVINATKTYTVVGKDKYGCANTASIQVRKNEIPKITYTAPESICYGSIASMTAYNANEYAWWEKGNPADTLVKGNTLNAKPETKTTYVVKGTSNGCTSFKEIEVDVLELPDITIAGDMELCVNDSTVLTGNGGVSYVWSTGAQTQSVKVSPLSTTTYTLTAKGENGCEAIANHELKVNPLPSFTIKGDRAVCVNETDTLTGVSTDGVTKYDYTWAWKGATTNLESSTDSTVMVLVDENKNFTVAAKDSNNCRAVQTFTVTSKPYPTITYVAPDSVCQRELLSISAFGANTYKWSTGSITNQMTDMPEYDGEISYFVDGTLDGCTSTKAIPIKVLKKPLLAIDGRSEVCSGDTLTLTATGAKTYKWNNGLYAESITSYPSVSSRYTVTGTAENGCSDTAGISVTVHRLPEFDIISENEICTGEELTVMASGDATTYYWGYGTRDYDDNITFNNKQIRIPIDKAIFLFVKGVDANGCVGENQKQIKAITKPDVFYTGNTDVCLGESVTLLGQGGESYLWKLNGRNQTGGSVTFVPQKDQQVELTGTLGLCSSTITIDVTTKDVPNLTIEGRTAICKGETSILTATGAVDYEWSTGETTRTISQVLKNSMRYVVTGTGYNGCSATKAITVKVNPLPTVKLISDSISGCPEIGTSIKLYATGADSYIWTSDPMNLEIDGIMVDTVSTTLFDKTTITVTGSDAFGCSSTDSVTITPMEFNPTIYSVTPRVIEEKNPIISLDGAYPENASWMWTTVRTEEVGFEQGVDVTDTVIGQNQRYKYPNTFEKDSFMVTVAATDKKGCVYKDTTHIYVWRDFWAPNAFTPNNDGTNDEFHFIGVELMTGFHYIVYNRIGTIVFETNDKDAAWDGNDMKGVPCPEGVYGYVATYESKFMGLNKSGEKRGTVTLIR